MRTSVSTENKKPPMRTILSIEDKKPPMRTSEDVYNRIKWDEVLMAQTWRIGYLDRFMGIMEVDFEEFDEQDEVPMHRIYYFMVNGKKVWDRNSRTDRVFGSTPPFRKIEQVVGC
eukprot:TRINITY_DN17993_c0_g1::TRINITY_DN17993_c0_g1_i1::g.11479::m.11479 TRINITY_DN17993_c0_g1::TRINITY_DN17993_c0_g1_i1::g.11479  ORF type:complete len:115 (-),score=6.48,sp/Q96B70/LENG9_HUMAN/44.94/2e-18,DUF504/PF04457.7/4.9e-05 TRINITY_DN17993_c0_g1_i1:52-396(-)